MDKNFPLLKSIKVFTETYRYLQAAHATDDLVLSKLKMRWAESILNSLNIFTSVQGEVSDEKSLLIVGNHVSYLDIPVLMSSMKDISFVAKKEIGSWPVFGPAAKKVDTVFVHRESGASRLQARNSIKEALKDGKRIVIFPSGTTCLGEKALWKRGAFHIAHELRCKIQPFRITYSPIRHTAYIDDDFFPTHLYNLAKLRNIKVNIEFHQPVYVEDPDWSRIFWHTWAQGGNIEAS
jgi:1-acyl-sn-glycerol-3-phosphate acyltransferase